MAMYWAEALANQDEDQELKSEFTTLANEMQANESKISDVLLSAQGAPTDIGGYFWPDDSKASSAMRPSTTLNNLIGYWHLWQVLQNSTQMPNCRFDSNA